jgi:hypothetical protein
VSSWKLVDTSTTKLWRLRKKLGKTTIPNVSYVDMSKQVVSNRKRSPYEESRRKPRCFSPGMNPYLQNNNLNYVLSI